MNARATLGEQHPNTLWAFDAHGAICIHLGQWVEARRWSKAAIDGFLAAGKESVAMVPRTLLVYGTALAMSGRRAEGRWWS